MFSKIFQKLATFIPASPREYTSFYVFWGFLDYFEKVLFSIL